MCVVRRGVARVHFCGASASQFTSFDLPVFAVQKIHALVAPPQSTSSKQKGKKGRVLPTPSTPSTQKHGGIENNPFCHACGDGGNLLCCDNCPASFHFYCWSVCGTSNIISSPTQPYFPRAVTPQWTLRTSPAGNGFVAAVLALLLMIQPRISSDPSWSRRPLPTLSFSTFLRS